MHILLVDDDEAVRDSVGVILASAGYSVAAARNGIEAMRLLEERRPDLIVTDILMPHKEGIESIREIRALAPETPIIAISGAGAQGGYLRIARIFGANAVLEKPFDPNDLLTLIHDLLQGSKAQLA